MIKVKLLAVVLAFIPTASAAKGDQADRVMLDLQKAGEAAQRNDCATVVKIVDPLMAKAIATVEPKFRAAAFDLIIACQQQLNKKEEAYQYARQATQSVEASNDSWAFRLALELETQRNDDALITVEEMANSRASTLNYMPLRWTWHF